MSEKKTGSHLYSMGMAIAYGVGLKAGIESSAALVDALAARYRELPVVVDSALVCALENMAAQIRSQESSDE